MICSARKPILRQHSIEKHEELEEIKVRHLVGEYDDATLTEKEQEQRADIAAWKEKAEKIAGIIDRYQQAIDAEQELNPLQQEEEQEEPFEEIMSSSEEEPLAETESESESVSSEEEVEGEETLEEEIIGSTPVSDEEEESEEAPEEATGEMLQKEVAADTPPDVAFEENEPSDNETDEAPLEKTPVEREDDEDAAGGELYSFGEDISGFDSALSLDGEFEDGEFELADLSGLDDEEEEVAVSYEIEALAEEESPP